ncbi:MAG: membrane protein insertase YidC [Ghiorsea sp.]
MESKNLFLAFALSMAVLLGWGWMFPQQQVTQVATDELQNPAAQSTSNHIPGSNPSNAPTNTLTPSSQSITTAAPIKTFGNDVLSLTINEKGWISSAALTQYQESLEDASKVRVLTTGEYRYESYVNSGVVGQSLVESFKLVSLDESSDQTVATFEGLLSNGYRWVRTYTLNTGSYILDVQDRVIGGAGLKLYRQVVEKNPARDLKTMQEHVGPIGLFQDKLVETSYDDLDETNASKFAAMGGWTGMMSRYFITAVYGTDQLESYRYYYKGDGRSYQAGIINDGVVDQGDAVFSNKLFIGPKSVPILRLANVELERSVDFGWLAFISKPMHEMLLWMNQYLTNFGVVIILLVVGLKILFFIPTQSAYRSMASMRKLQPQMAKLKDRYGDDRQKMGQEVMALYKKHKVNPLGGCLPILIQMPVFFALYKVLLISIELRQAPFYGWIEDMSVQDPLFILPVLMGVSMYIQQKLNPQPTDPMQAKIMQFLPVFMTGIFLFFPAGLVLYWVVNNVLSIIQQRLVMKSMNVD